ncbi:Protein dispatched [Diplonema papillatum]|nr:Protein dispatched [Diplonema papillatum]
MDSESPEPRSQTHDDFKPCCYSNVLTKHPCAVSISMVSVLLAMSAAVVLLFGDRLELDIAFDGFKQLDHFSSKREAGRMGAIQNRYEDNKPVPEPASRGRTAEALSSGPSGLFSDAKWQLLFIYTAPAGGNLMSPPELAAIGEFEKRVYNSAAFQYAGWRDVAPNARKVSGQAHEDSGQNLSLLTKPAPFASIMQYVFPSIYTAEEAFEEARSIGCCGVEPMCVWNCTACRDCVTCTRCGLVPIENGDGRAVSFDGQGTVMQPVEKSLWHALTESNSAAVQWFLGKDFSVGDLSVSILRSEANFGAPLPPGDGVDGLILDFVDAMHDAEHILDAAGIDFAYGGSVITDMELLAYLLRDALLATASIAIVYLYLIFHWKSVFLATVGMAQLLATFPAALFVYAFVFGESYIGAMNVLSFYIMIGIGVDDLFVFSNAFMHCEKPADEQELKHVGSGSTTSDDGVRKNAAGTCPDDRRGSETTTSSELASNGSRRELSPSDVGVDCGTGHTRTSDASLGDMSEATTGDASVTVAVSVEFGGGGALAFSDAGHSHEAGSVGSPDSPCSRRASARGAGSLPQPRVCFPDPCLQQAPPSCAADAVGSAASTPGTESLDGRSGCSRALGTPETLDLERCDSIAPGTVATPEVLPAGSRSSAGKGGGDAGGSPPTPDTLSLGQAPGTVGTPETHFLGRCGSIAPGTAVATPESLPADSRRSAVNAGEAAGGSPPCNVAGAPSTLSLDGRAAGIGGAPETLVLDERRGSIAPGPAVATPESLPADSRRSAAGGSPPCNVAGTPNTLSLDGGAAGIGGTPETRGSTAPGETAATPESLPADSRRSAAGGSPPGDAAGTPNTLSLDGRAAGMGGTPETLVLDERRGSIAPGPAVATPESLPADSRRSAAGGSPPGDAAGTPEAPPVGMRGVAPFSLGPAARAPKGKRLSLAAAGRMAGKAAPELCGGAEEAAGEAPGAAAPGARRPSGASEMVSLDRCGSSVASTRTASAGGSESRVASFSGTRDRGGSRATSLSGEDRSESRATSCSERDRSEARAASFPGGGSGPRRRPSGGGEAVSLDRCGSGGSDSRAASFSGRDRSDTREAPFPTGDRTATRARSAEDEAAGSSPVRGRNGAAPLRLVPCDSAGTAESKKLVQFGGSSTHPSRGSLPGEGSSSGSKYETEDDDACLKPRRGSTPPPPDSFFTSRMPLDERTAYALRKSGSAMFVTSATSAVAFLANLLSPLPAVRSFGMLMGILVLIDYLLTMTLYSTSMVLWARYSLPFCSNAGRCATNACASLFRRVPADVPPDADSKSQASSSAAAAPPEICVSPSDPPGIGAPLSDAVRSNSTVQTPSTTRFLLQPGGNDPVDFAGRIGVSFHSDPSTVVLSEEYNSDHPLFTPGMTPLRSPANSFNAPTNGCNDVLTPTILPVRSPGASFDTPGKNFLTPRLPAALTPKRQPLLPAGGGRPRAAARPARRGKGARKKEQPSDPWVRVVFRDYIFPFVSRRRYAVLVFFLLLTALFGFLSTNLKNRKDPPSVFEPGHRMHTYRNRMSLFGQNTECVNCGGYWNEKTEAIPCDNPLVAADDAACGAPRAPVREYPELPPCEYGWSRDVCGDCVPPGYLGDEQRVLSCAGCDGVVFSGQLLDRCGVCGGNDTCLACANGLPRNACGACAEEPAANVSCAPAGAPGGGTGSGDLPGGGVPGRPPIPGGSGGDGQVACVAPWRVDGCGVCVREADANKTCAGCDGMAYGAEFDACGVCGGGNDCVARILDVNSVVVHLVWGVDEDKSRVIDGENVAVYDDAFDPSTPACQLAMLKTCHYVAERAADRIQEMHAHARCMMIDFDQWLREADKLGRVPGLRYSADPEALGLPVKDHLYQLALADFLRNGSYWNFHLEKTGWNGEEMPDGGLKFMVDWFWTNMGSGASAFALVNEYRFWESVAEEVNLFTPAECRVYQSAKVWPFAFAQIAAINGFVSSVVTSVFVSFVVILVFTCHLWATLLVIYTMCSIMTATFAAFWALGWEIGAVEAVALSVVIGLSVDYCLHFAEAYLDIVHTIARDNLEFSRTAVVQRVLSSMGLPLINAALTTILATVPLCFCTVLPLKQFGFVMLLSIVFSIAFSICLFVPLLLIVGPRPFQQTMRRRILAAVVPLASVGLMFLVLYLTDTSLPTSNAEALIG